MQAPSIPSPSGGVQSASERPPPSVSAALSAAGVPQCRLPRACRKHLLPARGERSSLLRGNVEERLTQHPPHPAAQFPPCISPAHPGLACLKGLARGAESQDVVSCWRLSNRQATDTPISSLTGWCAENRVFKMPRLVLTTGAAPSGGLPIPSAGSPSQLGTSGAAHLLSHSSH